MPRLINHRMARRRSRAVPPTDMPVLEVRRLGRAVATLIGRFDDRQLRTSGEKILRYIDSRRTQFDLRCEFDTDLIEREEVPGVLREIAVLLRAQAVGRPTGLERRMSWLGGVMGLSDHEITVLVTLARFALFDGWRELMHISPISAHRPNASILALVSGLSPRVIDCAIAPGASLTKRGLLDVEHDGDVSLGALASRIAAFHVTDPGLLTRRLMPPAPASSLRWDDFDHIGPERDLAERLMGAGKPVSILLFGKPGTGKSEFARVLAKRSGRVPVMAGPHDESGGEPERNERLGHLMLLRALGANTGNRMIVVDEADDILQRVPGRRGGGSKLWLNRLVEDPQVPTVWIVNDPDAIGETIVRRMDLALRLDTPPAAVRARVVRRTASKIKMQLGECDIATLATHNANPAVLANAVRAARLMAGGAVEADIVVKSVLDALGQSASNGPRRDAIYDPALAKADSDLAALADRLATAPTRGWSLLLSGPSGTGKSAYARHLAHRLGLEVVDKRGADLLGPFVGQTEAQIVAAFAEAQRNKAMLLIDEADSFLYRREPGQRSWETSVVNEMLRAMERIETPFVATTNLADRLDPAVQRRFTLRVSFRALTVTEARALWMARFGSPAPATLVEGLTPGDFAVVANRAALLGDTDHAQLSRWLRAEVEARGEGLRHPAGFAVPEPVAVTLRGTA